MNYRRSMSTTKIVLFFILFSVVCVSYSTSPILAQGTPSNSNSALTAMAVTGDGWVTDPANSPFAKSGAGADSRANLAATTFSYYNLLGTAFNVRTTTTTYAYNFNGCIYLTGGTDNRLMAPLLISNGSIIKYLRIYFNDTSVGSDLTAWITRYQPGVTSEDLTSVTSTGSAGFGTALSPEIAHPVDTANWTYTVIVAPNGNSSENSICGIRVEYYAPSIFGVALPLIQKN